MVIDTLTAGDRVNLLELYARSVMLLELGRCAEWADLFEPHAVLRSAGPVPCAGVESPPPAAPLNSGEGRSGVAFPSGSRKYTGREVFVPLGRQMIAGEFDLAAGTLTPAVRCRRVLTDISLFCDGPGRAVGYAHLTVTSAVDNEPPRWLAAGLCSDRLIKTSASCWRFVSRTFTHGAPPPRDQPETAARPANSRLQGRGKAPILWLERLQGKSFCSAARRYMDKSLSMPPIHPRTFLTTLRARKSARGCWRAIRR